MTDQATFLGEPPENEATVRAYEADLESDGYVGNLTRLCAGGRNSTSRSWPAPGPDGRVDADRPRLGDPGHGDAAQRGDSYCCLAWGPAAGEAQRRRDRSQGPDGHPGDQLDRARAGARRLGAPGRARPECDHGARRRTAARRRPGRPPDLRGDGIRGGAPGLVDGQRRPRRRARPELAVSAPEAVRAAVSWGRAPSPAPSPE
jgi:hypothetical protein